MANIKAGTVYVDVKLGSVENMKKKLKEEMEKAGGEAGKSSGESYTEEINRTIHEKVNTKVKKTIDEELGKKAGRSSGDSYTDNFQKSFAERVGKAAAVMRGNLLAVLLPIIVAMGPFIGGALGGAIIASLPIAAMAGGLILIAKDPQVALAGKKLGEELLKGLKSSASVLIQPVLAAIDLIRKRFPELLKPIQGMFLAVTQMILPFANSLINFLKPLLEGLNVALQKSGPIFQVFLKGLERLGLVIGDFFKKLVEDPEAIEGMADALDDLFGILVLVVKWFGSFIVSAAKAYAQFKDAWGAIKSWFTGTIVPSLKNAGNQLMKVFSAIGDFFKAWWQRLKDVLNGSRQSLMTFSTSAIATMRAFISNAVAVFGQLPGKIVSAIGNLGSRLYSLGVDAMRGFLNGLASIGPAIANKASAIANTVKNTISAALHIGSPSKVMEQIGKWTMEGFVNGLDSMMPRVAAAMPVPVMQYSGNFGDIQNPQMDKAGAVGVTVNNYGVGDVDPWRQAEDMYFMLTARGGTL